VKPAHPQRPAQPLLLVGWDGATPELIGPWMADGTLPNLAALARRGCWSRLRSLIHPLSPAAWTSALTGLNPGRHGIWDFGQREVGSYEVRPTDASMRHGATVWDVASDCGLRSAVLNVPLSSPSGPFDGLFVPGVGATTLEGLTRPAELALRIAQEVPGYRIDANAYEHADPGDFLAAVDAMLDARADLAVRLLQQERPDLMVAVFVASDRVQHAFWKQAELPWTDPDRRSWRFSCAVRDCYRRLDDALGRLVEAAGDDATVLVFSDHGFGDLDGDLYLNAALEEMGLLTVRRGGSATGPLGRLRRLIRSGFGGDEPDEGPRASLADVDWGRTRAFAAGLFGGVWLNLRGREPAGIVEPGPEAEELLERIAERLRALRLPGERTPLIDAVFRGADLYEGPRAEQAPDLVVVPHDYRTMTRAGREIGPPGVLVAEPAIRHTGNHRMDGVLVAGGPGVARRPDPGLQRLIDVTPTALALLGIEVPRGLDGRPMEAVLSCDTGWTDELPWREPVGSTGVDRDAVERQLKGLGYLAD
jgi:predicted AlkP superfamily phosphohydrolase/phosphomutase